MSAIAETWNGFSPDMRVLVQGIILMLALQGYKWLQKRVPALPDLKSAEPRIKQFVVAVGAFLLALVALPEAATGADILQLWLGHIAAAIGGHQVLTYFVNKPLARKRAANGG